MTYHDLLRKLHDEPFRPFRIRLWNTTAIDVTEPGSVIVGESSAVLPVDVTVDGEGFKFIKNWKTVSISYMVEFLNL